MDLLLSYVKQSQEYKDRLVECFNEYIEQGVNPNLCIEKVFREVGCSETDLTSADKRALMKQVSAAWRKHSLNKL